MAVQYVQESGGLGSILGGLATIGGALTGNPWLGALGTGINMMTGGGSAGGLGGSTSGGIDSMASILNDIIGGKWKNPASNSIATINQISDADRAQRADAWQKAMMYGAQNPYNRNVNNLWQAY